ncbi:hypothetical protein LSH36_202g00018 [Paralvinella palmiformis]|uniref:Sulfotransferase n=1 Tax=Paralvinella palmiformis TaxID=53620 RepID=A0AAD9JQ65_9ANNE|nr:hypothetical protein LSH36_202g00018 [Paralvinella palmiformis]
MPLELILHNYMLDLKASSGFRECVAGLNTPHIDQSMDNCSSDVQQICGPTVEHAIRMQCPTILNAGVALRDTIRQMEGDLDVYLDDDNITATLEAKFDAHLGSVRHSLPPNFDETFPKFLRHQFCLASLEQTLKPCRPQVVDACSGKTLGVVHMVRLKSEDLRFVLRDFPTIHLVFYVRDPRAVAHSRVSYSREGQLKSDDISAIAAQIVDEAEDLCARMLADYWEMVKLQNKFPKVSFVVAKYEDMVLYPYEMALEFYNHMGLWLPESYKLYVETHMIVDKAEYLFGSGHPGVGNASLHHWRDLLNKNEIREINKHCRDVLDLFQYSV